MSKVCYIRDAVQEHQEHQLLTTEILKHKKRNNTHEYVEHVVDDLLDSYNFIVWHTKHPDILKQARRLGNVFNGRVVITNIEER